MTDSIILLGSGKGAIFADFVLEEILKKEGRENLISVSSSSVAATGLLNDDKETLFAILNGKLSEKRIRKAVSSGMKEDEKINPLLSIVGAATEKQSPVIFKRQWLGETASLDKEDILLSQIYLKAFSKSYKCRKGSFCDGALIPYGCYFPLSFVGAKESLFCFFPCEKPKNSYEMTVNFLCRQAQSRAKKSVTIFSPEEESYSEFKNKIKRNIEKLNL